MHYFDLFGWYSSTPIAGRSTNVAPVNLSESVIDGALRSNWTGHAWEERAYSATAIQNWQAEKAAAKAAADALLAHEQADEVEKQLARADATIGYLVNHTNAEINTKVQTDITNLATAKDIISRLAIAVAVLSRKELR